VPSFDELHDVADANEYVDATWNGHDKDDVNAAIELLQG
jgi:hypothetical protein